MKLTILATSHVQGQLTADDFRQPGEKLAYGLSRAASLIEAEQETALDPVVYIDNGDFSQGSPLSRLYTDQDLPGKLSLAFGKLNLLSGNLGSGEFSHGIEMLEKTMYSSNFLTPCGNVLINGKPAFGPAFVTKKLGAIKLGILGLTTQHIQDCYNPDYTRGMDFISAVEAAERWIPVLKNQEQCDVIVLSYHGNFEKDPYTGETWDPVEGRNEAYALLNSGLDFNVLVTGHQSSAIADEINGIAVIQPQEFAKSVGKVVFDFERGEDRTIIPSIEKIENLSTSDWEESKTILKDYQQDADFLQDHLNQSVAQTDGQFHMEDSQEAQVKGHAYFDLINEIQREAVGADLSATSLFDQEASGFSSDVTRREIFYACPRHVTVNKVEVTGAELRDILEHNAGYFDQDEEGQLLPSHDDHNQAYSCQDFDRYAGLDYEYDFSRPLGDRLIQFEKEGQAIEDDDVLTLAVSAYRANGGGGFPHFSSEKIKDVADKSLHDLVFHYMAKHFPIKN